MRIVSLIVLACCQLIYAQGSHDLMRRLSQYPHWTANFTQTVYHEGEQQQYQGQLSIMLPDKLRWETMQPEPQTIIVNQDQVMTYDPDLQQATLKKLEADQQLAWILLKHDEQALQRLFQIRAVDDIYWLTPRNKQAIFKEIKLSFDHGLALISLHDQFDQKIVIKFSNTSNKPKFDKHTFDLKPPKGVDVIRA